MLHLARQSQASSAARRPSPLLWECDASLLPALQEVVDEAASAGIGARLIVAASEGRMDNLTLTSGRVSHAASRIQGLAVLENGEAISQPGVAAAPFDAADGVHGAFVLHYDHGYVASQHEYLALSQAYAAHACALLDSASGRIDSTRQSAEAMMQMLAAHNPATARHSYTVRKLTMSMGASLGLAPDEMLTLEIGSLLHDVGKIGVPAILLEKSGGLTPDEWAVIRGHPAIGAHMVHRISNLAQVTPAIRHHHERWDGTGYPDRLSGAAIPLHARLIGVADAYEAMRTGRPYQDPRDPDETLAELRGSIGSQFDPSLAPMLPVLKSCDFGG